MTIRIWFAALALALALLPAAASADNSYPTMRYNEVRIKMAHNAMDAEEPILDMLIYHDIRAYEFDTHNAKHGTHLNGDWWLYHVALPSGVDFTGEDGAHTAETLSDALKEVQTFHRQNPQHEVITFYIDTHDDFEPGREPEDLDKLFLRFFKFDPNLAHSEIFSPVHLVNPTGSGEPGADNCPCPESLQSCVNESKPACRWPLLSQLRGKIIFVITGGNQHADEYVGFKGNVNAGAKSSDSNWEQMRAFVTYDHSELTSKPFDPNTNPNGLDRRPWEMFFNMSNGDVTNVATTDCHAFPEDCNKTMQQVITAHHLEGRSYDSNNAGIWDTQRQAGVQLIAGDNNNDNQFSYTRTRGATGFPFQCGLTSGDTCILSESTGSPLFSFDVITGDMNNDTNPDSFGFAEQKDPADHDYSSEVLGPESYAGNDWAKGCIMARADRDAKAAYFAVCRTANNHRIQVQWRSSEGAQAQAAGYGDGIDMDGRLAALAQTVSTGGYTGNGIPTAKAISFVKFTSDAGSKIFHAFASRDGLTWHHIYGPIAFDKPLVFKGLAATSHGTTDVRWRFEEFQIDGHPQNATLNTFAETGSWQAWLIGDGGHPSLMNCVNGSCNFPAGPDGNAAFFGLTQLWGQ